jgi:hypothetical protein
MNPYMYETVKARHNDILREVKQNRLVKQARAGQPGVIVKTLEKLGGLLIKIGKKLQRLNAPQHTGTLGWAEE